VTVELRPDAKLGDEVEAAEKERLAAVRAAMGDADLEAVVASTQARSAVPGCLSRLPCSQTAPPRAGPQRGHTLPLKPTLPSSTFHSFCLAALRHLPPPPLPPPCFRQELKKRQETPDPAEALTCIPSLHLSGERHSLRPPPPPLPPKGSCVSAGPQAQGQLKDSQTRPAAPFPPLPPADIPKKISTIPTTVTDAAGAPPPPAPP
jgi:hypothetical protein